MSFIIGHDAFCHALTKSPLSFMSRNERRAGRQPEEVEHAPKSLPTWSGSEPAQAKGQAL